MIRVTSQRTTEYKLPPIGSLWSSKVSGTPGNDGLQGPLNLSALLWLYRNFSHKFADAAMSWELWWYSFDLEADITWEEV